ncbi:hypothetical protein [Kordiimonas aestuarii]|uniref:hypothetical protein n=1 Tax=Kordiimonas aestuarii TaxID=1005925 RepID=UPI0021D2F869|nr:hypothetical protein [Kordiimonas aestuarii]
MRDLIPSILMTAFILSSIALMSMVPPSRGVVLAMYNPFLRQDAHVSSIINADAYFVAEGRLPGSFLVASDARDLPNRLRANGAILVLDPFGAAGCGAQFSKQKKWTGGLGPEMEQNNEFTR